jgi:DNA-binding transcriptional ArsR family regulator
VSVADDLHPATEDVRLVNILAALAEPVRLATVRALARKGESPSHRLLLEAGLEISRSTFSHHQRVLREAGLIRVRLRGTERILTLRRDDLERQFPGLLPLVLDTPEDRLTRR